MSHIIIILQADLRLVVLDVIKQTSSRGDIIIADINGLPGQDRPVQTSITEYQLECFKLLNDSYNK